MAANDSAANVAVQVDEVAGQRDPAGGDEVSKRFHSALELVEVVASEISRSIDHCVDFDELLAAGREGLFEAARRFDPKYGASFRTYANYRVEGTIIDAVRRSFQLSRRAYERLTALEAASRVSEGEYSTELRNAARWRTAKDPEDLINDGLATMATAAAMSIELAAKEPSADAPDTPEQVYERAELMAAVRAAIDALSEYEAKVVRLYYFEEKSHDAAAEALKVSKAWAHRLHTRAIAKLTKRLRQRNTD